jgi:phosphate transport system substrate-binding protein
MASRPLKDAEKTMYPDLQALGIARDGIVAVVHPSNGITQLTMDQLKAIYLGTTTNWKDVGGTDHPIVLYRREDGSGTGDFFNQTVLGGTTTPVATAMPQQGNEGVRTAVAANADSIGYVGFGYLDSTIKSLTLQSGGVNYTASMQTILDGTYPISRGLYLLTKGAPAGVGKTFSDYVLSATGQQIVVQQGFIALH